VVEGHLKNLASTVLRAVVGLLYSAEQLLTQSSNGFCGWILWLGKTAVVHGDLLKGGIS
jgi:hypothetical protein